MAARAMTVRAMTVNDPQRRFDAVIVGLGATGFSCARYLAAQGRRVAVTDDQSRPPLLEKLRETLPQVHTSLGGIDQALLSNARRVLLSPGVSTETHPALKRLETAGVEVIGDIELFCRDATAPIIAVTGTNGKSTVTTLLAEMFRCADVKAAAGGNLGKPALELLAEETPQLYVLELSSFQLETVRSLRAMAAVVLNISPDHLDRHADPEHYATLKARVYAGAAAQVVNLDDDKAAALARPGGKRVGYTLKQPPEHAYGLREYGGRRWIVKGREKLLAVDELRIAGAHNIANALAALALAECATCPRAAALRALRDFTGLRHRCQWLGERGGVTWINDSKATNVGATIAAVDSLHGDGRNIVLIAGGDGKGAEFSALAGIARTRLKAALVLGDAAAAIAEVLTPLIAVYRVTDLKAAVAQAAEIAVTGDVVLLSPACSSHDMFADYQARGAAFIKAVEDLWGGAADV